MRVIEQVQTAIANLADMFLIDGGTGTRAISFENLLENINQKIGWKALYGDNIPVEVRRNTWRGKNLGNQVTQAQWNAIGDGSFKGLFLGDYWELGGRVWRIVDFDYWWRTGDGMIGGENYCLTHHIVIMPDVWITQAKMNNNNETTGGYHGSLFYQQTLPQVDVALNELFGEDHMLMHREYLTNSVTNGHASGSGWYDVLSCLPNEVMIYGCHIMAAMGTGEVLIGAGTICKMQLAAMRLNPRLIVAENGSYWLRDIATAMHFTRVAISGLADARGASASDMGIRPVFGICKEN